MPFKIVGISGSPVKEGNTDTFLSTILDYAAEKVSDYISGEIESKSNV